MNAAPSPVDVNPPLVLQLAGHPLRWKLLRELARSDRGVHELTERLGEPQNLVSYHLGKLRNGHLIHARRSSADRRDTYYTLDLGRVSGALSAAGGALHPGLRLVPPKDEAPLTKRVKVLFLCTGNSARSPIAAALANARWGKAIKAYSAGSHPKPIHPNAVRVMREEHGIDLSTYVPRHLNAFAQRRFDRVITLCDRVREICPEFPDDAESIHWSIPNPATGEPDSITYPLFQQTAAELVDRISFLRATIGDHSKRPGKAGEQP